MARFDDVHFELMVVPDASERLVEQLRDVELGNVIDPEVLYDFLLVGAEIAIDLRRRAQQDLADVAAVRLAWDIEWLWFRRSAEPLLYSLEASLITLMAADRTNRQDQVL